MESKIKMSLTDFVDFVSKTGNTKLTQVKKVKDRDKYHPAQDFYKRLRESIIEIHQEDQSKKELDKILQATSDPKKVNSYQNCIAGYKKFWGRKEIQWFDPPFTHWEVGSLDVRINPELGLSFKEKHFAVKLYFKGEKLSKQKVDQILTLMEDQLRKGLPAEVRVAVLDVQSGKLFAKENDDLSLLPLLTGEAMSFETIWNQLGQK